MKPRKGFESNNSSASFIVAKSNITKEEKDALMAYNISEDNTDGWTIWETNDSIHGSTNMDNDLLDEYLEKIGFDFSKMKWQNY